VSRPDTRRDGPRYRVSAEERAAFERDGWIVLRGLLAPEELADIERVYARSCAARSAWPAATSAT
jgi:hypothetical protein